MKLRKLILHNFRSIKDAEFSLSDYSLLVGENNSGKTAVLTALRIFYEDGGLKYDRSTDFPKFQTPDQESWIELHFETMPEEQTSLKRDYQSNDGVLRVRRYFQSENKEMVRTGQSNIYGYENGILSKSLFYGAKNISQAKLGDVVHIPEVSRADDTLKTSGPSPFRDMLGFVMKKAVQDSQPFSGLQQAFDKFNSEFKEEASRDGFSVHELVMDINNSLATWQIRFGVEINAVRPEDIVKNLVGHYIEDLNLDSQRVKIGSYGQGLQRHLIYTLIRLSAKFRERRREAKKEFSPDFLLILFEEPEAFLHPSQQELLDISLRSLSMANDQQVLITTHSTHFVSRNVEDLPAICRINKIGPISHCYQISDTMREEITSENLGMYRLFCDMLQDPLVPGPLKKAIRTKCLGEDSPDEDKKLEEESIRYFLWLDAERASLFFAKHVVICEGTSEKVLLDYLTSRMWSDIRDRQVYFLDAGGKFNIHRHIRLLHCLGIPHSVLLDRDDDTEYHSAVNNFIEDNRTLFTYRIKTFDRDLETFLGISQPPRRDQKPLNVLSRLRAGEIKDEALGRLKNLVDELLPSGLGSVTNATSSGDEPIIA